MKRPGGGWLLIFFVTAALGYVVWVYNSLAVGKKIPANALVVEGWMPASGLEEAYREYQRGSYERIFITGSAIDDQVTLYVNSFLVVYPRKDLTAFASSGKYSFEIDAASSLGGDDRARWMFWINDQPVEEFQTSPQQGRIVVEGEQEFSVPDSVMIQFKNDKADAQGDRNLVIRSLKVNGVVINHLTASLFIERGKPWGQHRQNLTAGSQAGLAAHYFLEKGIPSEQVVPVPNSYRSLRRTYGNALALGKWLEKNPSTIRGMNVVSLENHSRRTLLTYQKVMAGRTQVGIIPVQNSEVKDSQWTRMKERLQETLALAYYYIFVLPWI